MAKENENTTHIRDIIDNTKEIMMSDASLATILDFERVLSELDLYTFDNWKLGELVEGPINEKYFVTCKFMWPHKSMPDPRGAERLLGHDCSVTYQKRKLLSPVEITKPSDFKKGTKMAKLVSAPIWLVAITVPRKLIDDIKSSALDSEIDAMKSDEVEYAYDVGDDETIDVNDNESQEQPDMFGEAPPAPVPEELPK